jgi:hypothetical protein
MQVNKNKIHLCRQIDKKMKRTRLHKYRKNICKFYSSRKSVRAAKKKNKLNILFQTRKNFKIKTKIIIALQNFLLIKKKCRLFLATFYSIRKIKNKKLKMKAFIHNSHYIVNCFQANNLLQNFYF